MSEPSYSSETTAYSPPQTVEECAAIALAEFVYWEKAAGTPGTNSEPCDVISMAASGAAANIFAAIKLGARAPWHPKPELK